MKSFVRAMLVTLAALNCFAAEKPIRALIVTGGCCHNYAFQTEAIMQAVNKLAKVEWVVLKDPSTGTREKSQLYTDDNWAKGYDIVVHNECFADTDDAQYIRRITAAHKAGVAAVVIHCAMHTYRAAQVDDWREFLGVTSRRHDHMAKYSVKAENPKHPIMKDFPETWTTPADELYVIEKLWPNTKSLATSVSVEDGKTYTVAWTSEYGAAKVFGTTFGHSDETFRDPVFLNMLSRGFLWASGQLK